MPTIVYGFDWPDRIVIGTVGEPGSRTFYLQARAGARVISVALEKEQSRLLAEKIDEILDGLMARDDNRMSIPSDTPIELVDNEPLEPVDEQFRAGAITLGWDPSTAQVVIEAYPIVEVDADDDIDDFDLESIEPVEMLQVRIPVGTARAFAKRTGEVVGQGRPICGLCGTPMDPDGHVCPAPGDL
jgi:uncharacterized repeat protein (TIGR03847 family)